MPRMLRISFRDTLRYKLTYARNTVQNSTNKTDLEYAGQGDMDNQSNVPRLLRARYLPRELAKAQPKLFTFPSSRNEQRP